MLLRLRQHFPETKTKWWTYTKIFLPIIIGATLFALNGVVDNFMVGHINQGVTALGAVNSWTNILTGWLLGVAAGGSVLIGQFYHAKRYDIVKEVARYRYYLCFLPALVLAIISWVAPDFLIHIFYAKKNIYELQGIDLVNYNDTMHHARLYMKIIAIQWLLISISFSMGNKFREIGQGQWTMYWGIGTLATNITLNAVLMYGINMGVDGAAWASVAGRLVAITTGVIVMIKKKLPIGFAPWTIFKVSWKTRVLFWKRFIYIFSIFTVTFFITYRNYFYSNGFPSESGKLGIGVSGLAVAGLASSMTNIFTTTFSALASMSAHFVGSELGKGNLEQAKKNSDELKGFSTVMALGLSCLAIIFGLLVPYISFLGKDQYDPVSGDLTMSSKDFLSQVRNSIIVIALYYPMWIWFSASYRNGNSGGKGGWFAFIDWIFSGLQLVWLWIIAFHIAPVSDTIGHNFYLVYTLFFLSDFGKLIGMEILYYRYTWLHVLTKDEEIQIEALAASETENQEN